MTGCVQAGNMVQARECGADLCLEKPFPMSLLKALVAELLGQRRREAGVVQGVERRRSQRVAAELPVLWTSLAGGGQAAGVPQHGRSINVSREGMCLAVGAPLQPFHLVTLQIFLTGSQEPIQALGEGRWVREGLGSHAQKAGIELIAMQDRERALLVEELYAAR